MLLLYALFRRNMEIDLIFKIAAVGIIIAVLNQLLAKSGREDMATLVTIAGLVIVLMMILSLIGDFFDSVKNIFEL